MLLKIQLILLSLITLDANKQSANESIVIKLDTDQIIDMLTSNDIMMFVNKLAQQFAKKTAEHLIDQVKNKKLETVADYNLQANAQLVNDRSKKSLLEENEALALVKEPPPDGDNSELKFYQMTDDEQQQEKKPTPVIGLTKVNGRYFYRRLI